MLSRWKERPRYQTVMKWARSRMRPRLQPSSTHEEMDTTTAAERTHKEKSSWTPRHYQPANHKIFQERYELIKKWYEAWTKEQKWQLVEFILMGLSDHDLVFIHSLLDPLVPRPPPPEHREDFTRLLPRTICHKIFSYLDPRSLCRAAQVSWYWHILCEQNILWQWRCLQRGWFLPAPPLSHTDPGTVWKRHYLACVQELHWNPPQTCLGDSPPVSPSPSPLTLSPEHEAPPQSAIRKPKCHSSLDCQARLPWKHSSGKPTDLAKTTVYITSRLDEGWSPSSLVKTSSLQQRSPSPQRPPSVARHGGSIPLAVSSPSSSQPQRIMTSAAQSLPTSTPHPPLAMDAVLQPSLLEKLRLGEDTSSEHITLSAISQPATPVTPSQLVRSLEVVQTSSPFPKLPPYYNLAQNDTSTAHSSTEQLDTNNKTKAEHKVDEDSFVRQWTMSDFDTDSDY